MQAIFAHWSYTPCETPLFGILTASGMGWLIVCVWGMVCPGRRLKALVLQLAINTEIGVVSALAYVWGMGTSAEARFAMGDFPDDGNMLPRGQIAMVDPSQFLGEVRFHYQVSEVGMWIYGVTFLATMAGMLLFRPGLPEQRAGRISGPG